jgi:putative tricarboxylic transport membrane protein
MHTATGWHGTTPLPPGFLHGSKGVFDGFVHDGQMVVNTVGRKHDPHHFCRGGGNMGINARQADRIGGALALLIGGLALREGVRLLPYRQSALAGDHILPMLLGGVLVLLGLWLLLFPVAGDGPVEWPRGDALRRLVAVLLLLVLYRVLLDILGYAISTFVITGLLFRSIGSYCWLTSILSSMLVTLCLYVVFVWWLTLTFPEGLFGF